MVLRRTTVGIALASLGYAATVHAEDQAEAVLLRYAAPGVCPAEEQFTWQVTSRVSRMRAPAEGEAARVFAARVELTPEGAVGRLTITGPTGEESSRIVESADCVDLVDALALIVALAIDPHASLDSPAPPAAPPPPPEIHESPAPPVLPPPAPPPPQWQAEIIVHALLASGLAPGPLPGARIGAGIGSVSRGWLLPSVRASFALTSERDFAASVGSAGYRWTAFSLEGCPLQVPLWPRVVAVRACALGEWGWVQATGAEIVDSRSVSARWLAAGGLANLGVSPGRWWRFEARASAAAPLTRDRFWLGGEVAHQHPALGWRTEIGLGLRLP